MVCEIPNMDNKLFGDTNEINNMYNRNSTEFANDTGDVIEITLDEDLNLQIDGIDSLDSISSAIFLLTLCNYIESQNDNMILNDEAIIIYI